MSDRADAAPFSQLILLLPSISNSAAHWAEMWLNFHPGKCFPYELCVWISSEKPCLCQAGWWLSAGTGSWGCPWPCLFLYPFQFILSSIPRTEPPTEFRVRAVEIFLNTAGQKTQKNPTNPTHRSVFTLHLMSGASQSVRDLETVSQPGN